MIKIICYLIILIQIGYAINLYPLPSSFFHSIRLSPYYGIARFKSLDLNGIGGQTKKNHEVIGLGITWGKPFQGLGVNYQVLGSSVISPIGNDFKKSRLNLNALKLRWFVPIIDDGAGQMSVFGSWGSFFGHASVHQQSESQGIVSIKERSVTGMLVDAGVICGYKLNPDWSLFIEALYQVSYDEKATTLLSVKTAPLVELTGAKLKLGTSLRL